ncbi:MAG: restriction endonuclease subunit S [Methyloglobulus sp.]|nr:restriction endonuclease subunit S [Methyloglobulus sp.]
MKARTVKLGDLAKFLNGGTPSKEVSEYWSGTVPWISSADIAEDTIQQPRHYVTETAIQKSATNLVPTNTLLIVTRTGVGKLAITSEPLCFSQDITAILLPDDCNISYIARSIKSQTNTLVTQARGATIKGITRDVIENLSIHLPPLPEQKRIAAILDKADELKRKREAAIAKLDQLAQSIFVEMFGHPNSRNKKFPQLKLTEFFKFKTGKLDSNAANVGGKYPFFTCSRESFWIDEYAFDEEALLLAGNNANADYSVKYYNGRFNAYQRTYVLNVNGENSYVYAKACLEFMLKEFKQASKGSSTKYLTMGIFDRMLIQVPPLALQEGFADRFIKIEQLKTDNIAALTKQNNLFASLQHQAFAGHL